MAKLVGVIRSDDYVFERRQLPLQCDDNLTMVIQFEDACAGCTREHVKQKDLEKFVERFHLLSNDDIAIALMVTTQEIFSLLAQMVPCVGCRTSVERLFNQLVASGNPAFEPLIITKHSVLSIKREYLFDPQALYALFYIHGSKLNSVIESIPKSKKNKRCTLHSLDSHTCKTKTLGVWMVVWDLLSQECREEVVQIDCSALMETLENYLRKHRFCTECKAKVMKAYNILTGTVNGDKEKGYLSSLYEQLRYCPERKHLHVKTNTDYISDLIVKAEPEILGNRRERHAKTLDIAQEEVLTCVGIYLYERLHKIWHKFKGEDQTWQIMFYLSVDALRKNFEVALEKKRGVSNLELVCEEFLQEEQEKELRKELKKQRKKRKKNTKSSSPTVTPGSEKKGKSVAGDPEKENCLCDENTNVKSLVCNSCDNDHSCEKKPLRCDPCLAANKSPHSKMKGGQQVLESEGHAGRCYSPVAVHSCSTSSPPPSVSKQKTPSSGQGDCGYSSEGCDNCSTPSSRDGSDIACSEGTCNHDGDTVLCRKDETFESALSCESCNGSDSRNKLPHKQNWRNKFCANGDVQRCPIRSLQDMLEERGTSSEDEVDFISEEEIQNFKANEKFVNHQRDQLREVLRQRFANLQMRNPNPCSYPEGDIKN